MRRFLQICGGWLLASSILWALPAPTVTSITPSAGMVGTSVGITGTGFVAGAVAKLGTVNCTTTTFVSATHLTCVAPDQAGGLLLAVTVTNPDAQTGTLAAAWTQYFFFDGSSLAAGAGYPEKWTPIAHGYNDPFFDIVVDPDTGRNVSQITYVLCNINSAADHPTLGAKLTSYGGGSYGLRTYYIKYTFKSGAVYSYVGKETSTGSAQESWAIAANNLAQVTAPTIPDGLTYYNVYVGVSAGGPYYLQNASPLTGAQNWQEQTSCQTAHCAAGTSLSDDTAAFSPPASGAGACGASHDTAPASYSGHNYGDPLTFEYDTYQQLDSSNPFWKGAGHWWARGLVKFHRLGSGDANVQRKAFYPKYNSAAECPGAGVGYCYSGVISTFGGTGAGNQQDWYCSWNSADPAFGPWLWKRGANTDLNITAKTAFPSGDVTEVGGCAGTTEQTLYATRAYLDSTGNPMQRADEVPFVRHADQCLRIASPPAGPYSRWAAYVDTATHMERKQGATLNVGTNWTESSTYDAAPYYPGTFISSTMTETNQPQNCTAVKSYWNFDQWYYWEYEWQNNCVGCSGSAAYNGNGRVWVQGPSDPQPILIVECPNIPTSGPFRTYLNGYITLLSIGNQADRMSYKLINESRTLRDIIWTDSPQSTCPDFAGNPGVYPCIGPMASLLPPSHAYNNTNVGNTSADSPQVFTFTNPTGVTGNITGAAIGGTNPGDFSIVANTCGATIAPGASCTVSVSFIPLALGVRSASLVITSDLPGSPHSATLSGTGTGAPPAPAVSLSPLTIPFLERVVGTTSDAALITLYNSGDGLLNITSIVATGDFARTTTCGATLAAAASCDISVTFTPTAGGTRTGAITVTTDAASSPDVVSLSGVGLVPVTISGGATLSGGATIR